MDRNEPSRIFDTHVDWPSRASGERKNSQSGPDRLLAHGIAAVASVAFVSDKSATPFYDAVNMIEAVGEAVRQRPARFGVAKNAADLKTNMRTGKTSFVLAIENARAIEGKPHLLKLFAALGVRYMTLTWNARNELAPGALARGGKKGLTAIGRDTLAVMNDLGIVPDVSHLRIDSVEDVLKRSRAPVIASHSNAAALRPHPRNLPDDLISGISQTGGFVGVNLCSDFLSNSGRARISDFLGHVEHMVQIAGPDHVAIGTDFDGVGKSNLPVGIRSATDWPKIVSAISESFNRTTAVKLLFSNAARVLLPKTRI